MLLNMSKIKLKFIKIKKRNGEMVDFNQPKITESNF